MILLVTKRSKVFDTPYVLITFQVYVNEASENVDEKMMESAINALFKFVLQPSDSVAKELSLAMSKAHPEYIWFVTKWQEDEADNAKFDEFIKLTYYNEGKDDSSQEYTVYGVKK